MKKIILIFMFVFYNISFSQNYVFKDNITNSEVQYEYDNSEFTNNSNFKIKFKLTINTSNKKYTFRNLQLDQINYLNKELLSNMLKEDYSFLITNYSKNELKLLTPILDRAIMAYKSNKTEEQLHGLSTQGIYIYSSILNGTLRDNNLTFTPYSGYINAICSFICEEEITISKNKLIIYLEEKKISEPQNLGYKYINLVLPKVNSETTSFYELHNLLNESFEGRWPDGGQCGCCGNYSGPCLYWNDGCYLHDLFCQGCQHSWCFSGCKPTKCKNNTLPWYPNI